MCRECCICIVRESVVCAWNLWLGGGSCVVCVCCMYGMCSLCVGCVMSVVRVVCVVYVWSV